MSDSLYAKLNAVLLGILARLDVLEKTLDRLDRSGTKKPATSDSAQALS